MFTLFDYGDDNDVDSDNDDDVNYDDDDFEHDDDDDFDDDDDDDYDDYNDADDDSFCSSQAIGRWGVRPQWPARDVSKLAQLKHPFLNHDDQD